jgi:large subunit ribosomal protein L2
LSDFKYGTFVSCIELRPLKGSKIARSAGCYGIILNRNNNKIIIRLPSGEERLFHFESKALLGIVSNKNHKFKKKKKAGNNIWLGKKPIVRGVAKNCIDHPHGGGRGKTSKLVLASNFSRKVLKGVFSFKKYAKTRRYIFKNNKNEKK